MATVLVTGAANRIGKAIALALAENGYDIIVHYNRSQEEALSLQKTIKQIGREATLIEADFSQQDQSQWIEDLFQLPSPPDIIIHAASHYLASTFDNTEIGALDYHWRIHCRTPYMINQAFVKHRQQGQIIYISDAKTHRSDYFPYMLTKNAVEIMTTMLAKELAPHFRVNAIAPGFITAPPGDDERAMKSLLEAIPLHAQGKVSDITDTVLYLLNNHFITGQIIAVDGGISL